MTTNAILEEKKVFYVPKQLVYEELNGRKMYRRGYKNVLNQTKTIEEIMGCSSLQGIIISAQKYQYDEHYFNVAPKMVIEVDVKIELENINAIDYLTEKNKTLFGFGVERVVWVLTEDKKIILAEPNQDWVVSEWSTDFPLLDGSTINLERMIEKKGYKI